jgi:dihydroorotase
MRLLLRNGRVLDPAQKIDMVGDVLLGDERVLAIGKDAADAKADQEVDCTNLWVCPGFIDIHVHLREPGQEYKENVITGTHAAAAGGFTTICCMPNTTPPLDNPHLIVGLRERMFDPEAGGVAVEPICALTKGMKGEQLTNLAELQDAGAVAASDDAFPIQNAEVLRRGMEYCKMLNLPVVTHCEDKSLSDDGVMNAGRISTILGLKGMPREAEEVQVARNCILSLYTQCRLHIAHVSTWWSVELIKAAKGLGAPITAEACPHHFILTEEAIEEYDTNTKCSPPLRTQRDVEAIIQGLADGVIDCIASDHAPHANFEKETTFAEAAFGIAGIETLVGLTLTHLTHKGVLSPLETVRCLSTNPSKAVNLMGGSLRTDMLSLAQVTVVDPNMEWTVDAQVFRSKARNTPFHGWKLKGKAMMTIWSDIIYRDPLFLGITSQGK